MISHYVTEHSPHFEFVKYIVCFGCALKVGIQTIHRTLYIKIWMVCSTIYNRIWVVCSGLHVEYKWYVILYVRTLIVCCAIYAGHEWCAVLYMQSMNGMRCMNAMLCSICRAWMVCSALYAEHEWYGVHHQSGHWQSFVFITIFCVIYNYTSHDT